MRLLETKTYKMVEFWSGSTPRYAILSHTWGEGEVLYQDMQDVEGKAKLEPGWSKIAGACSYAAGERYKYIWIDTCCIDKSSSAELQEAINSMFAWYSDAEECIAYLDDYVAASYKSSSDNAAIVLKHSLERCKWFTRGWTLQELIAPKEIQFCGPSWCLLSSRTAWATTISAITGVDEAVLLGTQDLSTISIARRMSWAAHRNTSRIEDQAYSLLGIFGVSMPMLYGEGRRSFRRLQEEIMKESNDESIFAWDAYACGKGCLLADSPANFAQSGQVVAWSSESSHDLLNRGLRITLPLLGPETLTDNDVVLAILRCRYESDLAGAIALRLRKSGSGDSYSVRPDYGYPCPHSAGGEASNRLAVVTAGEAMSIRMATIQINRQYVPHVPMMTFWLAVARDAETVRDLRTIVYKPASWWSLGEGVLKVPCGGNARGRGSFTRGLVAFELAGLDYQVLLFMGHDRVVAAAKDKAVNIPGLGFQTTKFTSYTNAYGTHELPNGTRHAPASTFITRELSYDYCTHRLGICKAWDSGANRCRDTPTFIRFGDPLDGGSDLFASIEERQTLQERVWVVKVGMTRPFELDSTETVSRAQESALQVQLAGLLPFDETEPTDGRSPNSGFLQR